MTTLREYQQSAVDTALNYLYDRDVGNQVIAMPTGSGKAYTQASIINELVKEYPNLPVICPTHVKEIVEQNVKAIKTINPQLDVGVYSAGLKIKQTNHQIIFGGIASMINHLAEFGERVLCVVDEAHRMSPKDDTSYFKFFNHFKKMGARLIGFSATPYRMGNGLLTDTELFDDITVDYCTRKWWQYFIAHNYLVPPIPKPTKTEFDLSNVGTVAGEFNQHDADLAINVGKLNYQAALEILQYGAQRNHVLVACSSVDHAIKMSQLFEKFGETSGFICSSSKLQSTAKNDQNIQDFTEGKIKYLCVYGQCVIGFDFPALDMIAVLRATKSVAFWCLDEQTEILTNNGWKKYNAIDCQNDLVASMNKTTEAFEFVEIDGYIHRELEKNEYMMNLQTPQFDVRVSNKHNMIYKTRFSREKTETDILTDSCENVSSLEYAKYPVACVNNKLSCVDLSEDELTFLGLFMTDGTLDKSNKAITIYQTEKYPEVLNTITKTLNNLGFKYKEKIIFRYPYSPMHRFQISKGLPRNTNKHLRGWEHLEKWIDKNFPIDLLNVSTKQFEILLAAINMGDGSKFTSSSIDWKPASYCISTGNILFAERLQEACIRNGYRCNISKQISKTKTDLVKNSNGCLLLHIKKQNWNTISKINDARKTWIKESFSPEKIWCVENKNGTLITRRNGKIAILGNCQLIGRGTRPFEDKTNCLVLDFCRNALRLGPIDEPRVPKQKGKGVVQEVPLKECPAADCGCYNHISARVCDMCGFEFQFKVIQEEKAGTTKLIGVDPPQIRLCNITRVFYDNHISKKDGKNLIKVSYYHNEKDIKYNFFTEYLDFEGKMKFKAKEFWLKRVGENVPKTNEDALNELKKGVATNPKQLKVWVNKQPYPEIIEVIL